MRRTGYAAIAAIALTLLAGCEAGPASDGGKGVVTSREVKSPRKGPDYHVITIKRDLGGRKESGRVTKKTYDRCTVGERWPACKKGTGQ